MPTEPVGVLLLGSDFKALAVARSLGRRGIPIGMVDNLPRSAWFSRFTRKRFRWHGPMTGTAFVGFLLDIAATMGVQGWVLWPAQDDAVELVARNRDRLSGPFRLITQPWEILSWAVDKRRLHAIADELGIPHPRTWYPDGEEALAELPVAFPVIVKPAVSIDLQYALGLKALPARDTEELAACYRLAARVVRADEIMVQEVVRGQGQYSVAAFANGERVASAMTARRTRQYPIDYGLSSSFVEAVEVSGLIEPATRLIARLRLTGMTEVEFIVDRRDLQPKLLDVNPRPWGWHGLCIACGLDYPSMQYDHAMGRPVPDLVPRYGPRWIRMLTDVPAGVQGIRAGLFSPGSYLRSLLGSNTVGSVFDLRDPIPAAGDVAVVLSRLLKARRSARSRAGLLAAELHQGFPRPSLAGRAAAATLRPPPESG